GESHRLPQAAHLLPGSFVSIAVAKGWSARASETASARIEKRRSGVSEIAGRGAIACRCGDCRGEKLARATDVDQRKAGRSDFRCDVRVSAALSAAWRKQQRICSGSAGP